jgi:carbon storage regulator
MLVLSRKPNQRIRIGDNIEIVVVDIGAGRVRLGIECPRSVPVHRQEVYCRIHQLASHSAQETAACHNPA